MTNFLLETESIFIRSICENDFSLFEQLRKDVDKVSLKNYSDELLKCSMIYSWKEFNSPNDITGFIFEKNTGDFCGSISMQHINNEYPEIGIELLTSKQNKGYAPEAIKIFTNWFYNKFKKNSIYVRIREENTHSQHIFKKLGAVYKKRESAIHSFCDINTLENISYDIKNINFDEKAPLLFLLNIPITNEKSESK